MYSLFLRAQHYYLQLYDLLTRGIWLGEALANRSLRGRLYAVLRIASMTWTGVMENSLASRAGALCFSSMLGLGPLVALVVMFSGAALQRTDPEEAIHQLRRAIIFIAPQVRFLDEPANQQSAPEDATARSPESPGSTPAEGTGPAVTDSELSKLLMTAIEGSQSKALGVTGGIVLIFIVIQLFSSIEGAFNDIWGVKRGRNWVLRIVFYWTAVSLGAVLAFASLTLMGAANLINTLEDLNLPTEVRQFFNLIGPLISFCVLWMLLTVFYKFIPNTSVGWWTSLFGAVIAVAAVYGNNFLAFMYLSNVVRTQSLSGSLALPMVLMLGLYVFWLLILVGGQITYAIQNVNYRSSRRAWNDLHHTAREGVALLVLTLIGRRFRECHHPFSVPELSELVRIPTQIINACLGRLGEMGLVSTVPPTDAQTTVDYCYQPARPLDRIRIQDFKELFEGMGAGPTREILDSLDPVVRIFHERLRQAAAEALGDDTLQTLIERLPVGTPPDEVPAPVATPKAT